MFFMQMSHAKLESQKQNIRIKYGAFGSASHDNIQKLMDESEI